MSGITWRGKMKLDPEVGLWVRQTADNIAHEIQFSRFRRGFLRRGRRKTIYNRAGRPVAEVNVHDSGNSEHEFDEHRDAVVRPKTIAVTWDMAREAHNSFDEVPSLEEAQRTFNLVRAKRAKHPDDPQVEAEWGRAKAELNTARMLSRMRR